MKTIFSGFITGAVMTVPGVSGGSAAMILGIYDDLVRALSQCLREPRRNICLLLQFSLGGAAGILLTARLITWLMSTPAEIPLRFLFLGAVAGGVPMIFRKANIRRLSAGCIALVLCGISAVLLISSLPQGLFSPGRSGLTAVTLQFAGGIILAAALVLPGISASHMLVLLGIYDDVMQMVCGFDLVGLVPLLFGGAIGLFLTARLLDHLIERHQSGTYMVILGFMLASLRELLPQGVSLVQVLTGVPCVLAGFVPVYLAQSAPPKSKKEL